MTWSLSATGHVIRADIEQGAEVVEHAFLNELHKLLSDPRWGTMAVHFAGVHVTSDLIMPTDTTSPAEPAAPREAAAAVVPPEGNTETTAPPEPATVPAQEAAGADAEPTTDPAPAGA